MHECSDEYFKKCFVRKLLLLQNEDYFHATLFLSSYLDFHNLYYDFPLIICIDII